MHKIDDQFIIDQYESGVDNYAAKTIIDGLWDSEIYVFNKYLAIDDQILDLGCGTGRTTIPLFELGFKHINGIDLTPGMIDRAKKIAKYYALPLDFTVGDASRLSYKDKTIDSVIFSFNGIMSIPRPEKRLKAFHEIRRVLKKGGKFIFTTHDRLKEAEFLPYWEDEKARWQRNEQDPRLYVYGDRITTSNNEERMIFIHIPSKAEVQNLLSNVGFEVIETFYRSDLFDESEAIKAFSGECRFWVVKKI